MPDRFNKSQTKEYLIFIDQGAGKESKSHLNSKQRQQTLCTWQPMLLTDLLIW